MLSDHDPAQVRSAIRREALALLARAQGVPTPALRQRLDEAGQLAGLRAQMRREKTVRRLLGESGSPPAPHDHDHSHES